MFSKKVLLNRIGPRLVIWFTLLLAVSLVCVSTTVYYLLSSSLRESDQELITRLTDSYALSIQKFGVESLVNNVSSEVFLSVLDDDGRELYKSVPKYLDGDFEDDDEIKEVRKAMRRLPLNQQWDNILIADDDLTFYRNYEKSIREYLWRKNWMSLLPLVDNDMVEIYTKPLVNGGWLRVGRSSEDREEHLAHIRNLSILVLTPFIFLGFLVSLILARTILAPLKSLTQRVVRIRQGETDLRAKIHGTNDEVDTLSVHFNGLVDHNQKLLRNLKDTLDNIAHDLRTPLTRFRIEAEDALSKEDVTLHKETLQNGLENIDHITALLNAIMDLSESETATFKLKKELVDVELLLNNVVDLYHYVAEEKDIQLELSLGPQAKIQGDRTRLYQMLGNLVDNAIKYSPSGSKVKISSEVSGPNVTISVQDEGQGIEAEDLEYIWDRLYRADKSRSTHGLGIGLSLVKAIARAHGGDATVTSQSQQGATFFVTLPICNDPV